MPEDNPRINPQDVANLKIYNQLLSEEKNLLTEIGDLSEDLTKNATDELWYQEQYLNMTDEIGGKLRDKDTLERAIQANKKNQFDIAQAILVTSGVQKEVLEDQLNTQKDIEAQLAGQLGRRKEIDEQMEVFEEGMIGMFGKLPGMAKVSEKALKSIREELEDGKDAGYAMGEGLKTVGKEAAKAGGEMLLAFALESILAYSDANRDISRSMQINKKEAFLFQQEMKLASFQSQDLLATTLKLTETHTQLNAIRGTAVNFSRDELVYANRLLQTNVLSAEAVGELSILANVAGQSIEEAHLSQIDGVLAAEKEHGVRLNIKQVLEESSKVTGQIRAQLGGNLEAINKSVAVAKQFGMTLEGVASAGASMLDFQSSIENELQAELFLGKQLNLEKARLAALTGDYDTLTKEINANVGDFYEFSKLNVLQQEKLAASVGMTADQLSDQLLKKADLNALEKKARDEGRDDIADNMQQLSVQDKMQAAMERFQATMADILTVVMPIFEGFSTLVGWISESTVAMGALAAVIALAGIASMVQAVTSIWSAFGMIPFGLGIPLAIVATATMFGLVAAAQAKAKKAKDGVIDPQGGLVVSGQKGTIQLDPEDQLIAGTDLEGKKSGMDGETIEITPESTPSPEDHAREERYQAESIALLKKISVATAASSMGSMIATIAYSGFDAVKADTHYGTKFK